MPPSVPASTRASHAPPTQPQPQQQQQQSQSQSQSHPPPSAAQLARLADKKKEFEAVDALQRASALFLRRLEGLADDCEAMADAGIGASRVSFSISYSSPFAFFADCVVLLRVPTAVSHSIGSRKKT